MPGAINEIGNKYGRLTVVGYGGLTPAGKVKWICKCDCGGTTTVVGSGLRNGVRKSCGCLHHEDSMNLIDEIGNRYGKLTVIARAENTTNGNAQWLCRCDCGNEVVVRGRCLRRNNGTKTCGCFHQDKILPNGLAAMRKLLYVYKRNAKTRGYEWLLTDDEFYKMTTEPCHYCGSAPMQVAKTQAASDDYIYNGIDRMDSTKGYTPENCVPCCGICNRSKMDMSYQDFLAWVEKVHSHVSTYAIVSV